MSKFIWTKETSLQLIEKIRKRPEMWSLESPGYKDKLIRELAFEEVGQNFGCTAEDVRKKWHALMVQYRREKQFIENRGDRKTDYVIWFGYYPMKFIDSRVYVGEKTKSTTKTAQSRQKLEQRGSSHKRKRFDDEMEFISTKCKSNINKKTIASVTLQPDGDFDESDIVHVEEYDIVDAIDETAYDDPLIEEQENAPEQEQQQTAVITIEYIPTTEEQATDDVQLQEQSKIKTEEPKVINETIAMKNVAEAKIKTAIVKAKLNALPTANTEEVMRDDIKIFTELVEQCLRKLKNPRRLCIVRHKIKTVLFEAEMEELDEASGREGSK